MAYNIDIDATARTASVLCLLLVRPPNGIVLIYVGRMVVLNIHRWWSNITRPGHPTLFPRHDVKAVRPMYHVVTEDGWTAAGRGIDSNVGINATVEWFIEPMR